MNKHKACDNCPINGNCPLQERNLVQKCLQVQDYELEEQGLLDLDYWDE